MSSCPLEPEQRCRWQDLDHAQRDRQRQARPRRLSPDEESPIVYYETKTYQDVLEQLTLKPPKLSLSGTPARRRHHQLQLAAYRHLLAELDERLAGVAPVAALGPRQRLSPLAAS